MSFRTLPNRRPTIESQLRQLDLLRRQLLEIAGISPDKYDATMGWPETESPGDTEDNAVATKYIQ